MLNNLFLLLLHILISSAFSSEGEKLFTKHCISCHSPGQTAEKFDFTKADRIYAAKGQLIQSINNNAMPPMQLDTKFGILKLKNTNLQISNKNRQIIINWISQITENSNKTYYYQEQAIQNELTTKKYDFKLEFNLHDLRPDFVNINNQDYLYEYSIDIRKFRPELNDKSIAGYIFETTEYTHHIYVFTIFGKEIDSQIFWGRYKIKKREISDIYQRKFNFNDKIYFFEHIHFTDANSLKPITAKVKLYFSKQQNLSNLYNIGTNPKDHLFILNNYFSAHRKINKDVKLLALAPHMHESGQEIQLSLFRPIFADNIPLAKFSGWAPGVVMDFVIENDYRIKKGDILIAECHYSNTNVIKTIGFGADEEMCVVSVRVALDQ